MNFISRLRTFAIVPVLAALVASPASLRAAAPELNSQPDDYPTLQVGKDGGAWQTSMAATAGDTLSLLVWDHNSVPDTTATNVKVKVTLPDAGTFTMNHTATAVVSADNVAKSANGAITITTDGETKLSYIPGSAKLFKNVVSGNSSSLVETSWPAGVTPDQVVTTGVNLGDQQGCWQYARAVILQVKLEGKPVEHKAVLTLKKEVRRTENDQFAGSATANPGNRVQYKLTVRNIDGQGVAQNVSLHDLLPVGLTYVPGSGVLTKPDGTTVSLADGVTSDNGIVIIPALNPNETAIVTFSADTATTFTNNSCATNTVTAVAGNSDSTPKATADLCFLVPTPTPTPPTKTPELPHTGADAGLLGTLAVSGFGLSTTRYAFLKRKLKRASRNIDVA